MKNTVLVLLFIFSLSGFAQSDIHADGRIKDIKEILGSYPEKGSVEEAKDFEVIFHYQNTRTQEQCDKANAQANASLENFFTGPGGAITPEQLKKVKKHLHIPMGDLGIVTITTKLIYRRPRPYKRNPEVKPCIKLSKTHAYPSGHTAMGYMMATILSEYYPEAKARLMEMANEAAMNRVIGGVHHPSDIVAGEALGKYLAERYIDSEEFQSSLLSI